MKRVLAAFLVLSAGCEFRPGRLHGGKVVGGEVVVYSETAEPAQGWLEEPGVGYLGCHPPVGQKATWLGSGFTVKDKPGVWDRVRIVASPDDAAIVYLPAANLRPVPR